MLLNFAKESLFHGLVVDGYAVPSANVRQGPTHVTARLPVDEMWRREFTTLESLGKQRRCEVAYGAFAVGAGDMYRLPWEVDILQEPANPRQTGLDHGVFKKA